MARKSGGKPERLDRFQLLGKLGEGASSVVYKALDTEQGVLVAVKVFSSAGRPKAGEGRRFRREFQAIASLRHPNIVPVHEFSETPCLYYTMELMEGRDLGSLIRAGTLRKPLLVGILLDICRGLEYIHRRGVIHGDLKPSNILFDEAHPSTSRRLRKGATHPVAKIADFGLAQGAGFGAAPARSIAGTLAYMPPEQVLGIRTDGRADLYSLGAVLFECLTGRTPFGPGPPEELFAAIVEREAPRPQDIQRKGELALSRIAARLLRKDPKERFQSAQEVARELAPLQGRADSRRRPPPEKIQEPRPESILVRPSLTGRKSEMQFLDHALARAKRGRGEIIWIRGQEGIGKTTLLLRFATRQRVRGIRIYSREDEITGTEPLSVFIPLLTRLHADWGSRVPKATCGGLEKALSVIAPYAGVGSSTGRLRKSASPPSSEGLHRLFQRIGQFLAAVARQEFFVLILDELKPSDKGSVALLKYLSLKLLPRGERARAAPVLIMVAAGEEDQGMPVELTEGRRELRLQRLDKKGTAGMVGSMLGGTPPEGLGEEIYGATGGNPLHTEEAVRFLSAEGVLFKDPEGWRLTRPLSRAIPAGGMAALPSEIRKAVGNRLARLPPEERDLLLTAALLGQNADTRVVARAMGKKDVQVRRRIRRLTEKGFLLESKSKQGLVFAHERFRSVLMEEAPNTQVRKLHARAVEAIEAVHAGNADRHAVALAHHAVNAGDLYGSLRYLRPAAEMLQRASSTAEAERCYAELLACLESLPEGERGERIEQYMDALRGRGELLLVLSRYAEAKESFGRIVEAAGSVGDRKAEAEALVRVGEALWRMEDKPAAIRVLRESIGKSRRVKNPLLEALAREQLGIVYNYLGKNRLAIRFYRSAVAKPELQRSRGAYGRILRRMSLTYLELGQEKKSARALARALEVRGKAGDKRGDAVTLINLGGIHMRKARFAKANRCFREALKKARSLGERFLVGACLDRYGYTQLLLGRFREAESSLTKAIAIQRELRNRMWVTEGLNNLGNIEFYRGSYGTAMAYYGEALEINRKLDDRNNVARGLYNLANSLFNVGLVEDSFSRQEEALEIFRKIEEPRGETLVLVTAAEHLHALGDYARAGHECRNALDRAKRHGWPELILDASLNMAMILADTGRVKRALNLCERIREDLKKNRYLECDVRAGTVTAHVQLRAGEPGRAIDAARAAIRIARKVPYRENLVRANAIAGRAYRRLGHPARAVGRLRAAIDTIDEIIELAGREYAASTALRRDFQEIFADYIMADSECGGSPPEDELMQLREKVTACQLRWRVDFRLGKKFEISGERHIALDMYVDAFENLKRHPELMESASGTDDFRELVERIMAIESGKE